MINCHKTQNKKQYNYYCKLAYSFIYKRNKKIDVRKVSDG